MIRKVITIVVLFIILLRPPITQAEGYKSIEVFDPKQDKVVKIVETNEEINNMVLGWISNINEIYAKVNPITDDGYAIRFPLDPAIQVQNKWLKAIIKEVYLIIPENNPPFLMIFETENRLLCFPFTGEITVLSDLLDFKFIR